MGRLWAWGTASLLKTLAPPPPDPALTGSLRPPATVLAGNLTQNHAPTPLLLPVVLL